MKCVINAHGVICDSLEAKEKAVAMISPHHGTYGATDHTIAYAPS